MTQNNMKQRHNLLTVPSVASQRIHSDTNEQRRGSVQLAQPFQEVQRTLFEDTEEFHQSTLQENPSTTLT